MKKMLLLIPLAFVVGLALPRCDFFGSDGGAGADAEDYAQIIFANAPGYDILAPGYSSGAGPWYFGTDVMALVLRIRARNESTTEHRYITFAFGDSTAGAGSPLSFTLDPGEQFLMPVIIRMPSYSSADRLWVNGDYSDMTDVSIHAEPMFYWKGL